MLNKLRSFAQGSPLVKQRITFHRDRVANGNSGATVMASFKPGFAFEVVDVQMFASGVGSTPDVDVKIGSTSCLSAAVSNLVAATRKDATLSATAANLLGSSSAALNLHVTTAAVAASGTSAAVGGNTGDGTITASPATGAGCKAGVYNLVCFATAADAGKFLVFDPDGVLIGVATVAVAFTTHLTFTIADGATDFVAGDRFTITVADGEYLDDLTVEVTIRPQGLATSSRID